MSFPWSGDDFGCKTTRHNRTDRSCPRAGRVARAMHALILQVVEEAFGRCIVPANALPAHRAGHTALDECLLKGLAGVLATAALLAERTGVRVGDLILACGNSSSATWATYRESLRACQVAADQKLTLEVGRGEERLSIGMVAADRTQIPLARTTDR